LALTAQCRLMQEHAPAESANAFTASRGDAFCGAVFGALEQSTAFGPILHRAWPD